MPINSKDLILIDLIKWSLMSMKNYLFMIIYKNSRKKFYFPHFINLKMFLYKWATAK